LTLGGPSIGPSRLHNSNAFSLRQCSRRPTRVAPVREEASAGARARGTPRRVPLTPPHPSASDFHPRRPKHSPPALGSLPGAGGFPFCYVLCRILNHEDQSKGSCENFGRPCRRRGFLCRCPVASHGKGRGDLRPSLAVCDGDRALIYNCFAGCDPRDVRAAIDKLDVNGAPRLNPSPAPARAKRKTTTADALDLWREAQPVNGTPVEIYLRARGFREPVPRPSGFCRAIPTRAGNPSPV